MPFKSKKCLLCGKRLKLVCKRDENRKKFCSHSHRQIWRYRNGEWNMQRMWDRSCTPEANKKKAHRGPDHPMWISDRSKVKNRPRYELTAWRKKVFERDNYTCQMCHQRGGKLQADHIRPYALYPEERWNLENGRTLCVECHKKTDTHGWKTRELKKLKDAIF